MLKLARALVVLIGVLILLYGLDLALLKWWTSDPMIARLDAAAPPGAALPPPAESGSSLSDQSAAQEQLFLAQAYEGLATWAASTTALTGLALLAWFAVVFSKERRTFGPASQSSAFLYWILILAAYVGGAVGLFFWAIAPMDLVRYILDLDFYLLIFGVGLMGAIAIWIASIFGIGPVLRPSVPLGARFS